MRTNAQTAQWLWCFFLESIISKLATSEISNFQLVSVAERDCLSLALSETPKTGLSVTSHINCIVARCLINVVYLKACCLYQVMMTLHFLNDVANDAESTQKSKITS